MKRDPISTHDPRDRQAGETPPIFPGDPCTHAIFDARNARIKLLDIDADRFVHSACCQDLRQHFMQELGYTKLLAYARDDQADQWQALGFSSEAVIRGFYEGGQDARLWALYSDPTRAMDPMAQRHDRIVRAAAGRTSAAALPPLPAGLRHEPVTEADAQDISCLLLATFSDYPTSLEPEEICRKIRDRTSHYRMIRDADGQPIAVAAAEIDARLGNAELTDCATLPEARGQGLMSILLAALEEDLARHAGITDFYTIARAGEAGINHAFGKLGYAFTGRLLANCRMPNGWEAMNVWCKKGFPPAKTLS